MAVRVSCFALLVGKKKKKCKEENSSGPVHTTLEVKLEEPMKALSSNEVNSKCVGILIPYGIVKVVNNSTPGCVETVETAYEGEDEHEESSPMKRGFSDFDLHNQHKEEVMDGISIVNEVMDHFENESAIQSGHVSDPGIERTQFWASPKLKRSCSNLERGDLFGKISHQLPPSKSQSFEDLQNLRERENGRVASLASAMTPCSADRVMLKKHSSSQVLPSRSRKLWWKLLLWSHRNSHKLQTPKAKFSTFNHSSDQRGGYCSDTLERNGATDSGECESPRSECNLKNKQKYENFHGGVSGLLAQNQWVAFSLESSSLARVNEWVNSLDYEQPLPPTNEDTKDEGCIACPESQTRSATHMTLHFKPNISKELLYSNSVIQSLNSSSTVAHITGMSLKVIPTISHFSSLRTVNLSGNFLVYITPGSLPKGLHTLNLSRNKIVAIEGLRELTRLRVLDISYNRISRIGHGLSNSTLIKELYLAGNKISSVEGLHRLLKLTVVDLSFNKITTAKALGQLVANYNSLLALNILGNPIQSNIGEDQLRKVVSGLLPQLAYLNKQPVKPQRAREVVTDIVVKAALGNNGWTSRRKTVKRVSHGGSSSSSIVHQRAGSGGQKNKIKSKNSSTKRRSPLIASSHYV
ncbi:hypothetical protein GIB67_023751 [Kingdonia uniflora]|uniref:Outer arm dynein light chain 1 protein n=1 Tax=Kingdonia uniflora TaxID=39325 RepID=A0A7J7LGB8_9MAGN|nr:hypothetical protein GIB67_023751 [Kingdonia uniflora]